VFPLRVTDGTTIGSMVTVEHLGRDARYGLRLGDWVAVVDDISELLGKQLDMLQVIEIEPLALRVTLSGTPSFDRDLSERPLQNPLLRRWDHQGDTTGGALPIVEGEWLPLEDNIEIRFIEPSPNAPTPNWYRATDWWWFAARTVTGDVEWPMGGDNEPMAQKPLDHGHRYAPLALVTFDDAGAVVGDIEDLRRQLIQLWS
jgi:hypothetical protein